MLELSSIPWLVIVTGAIVMFAILFLILRTKTRRSRKWEYIGSNDDLREIPPGLLPSSQSCPEVMALT